MILFMNLLVIDCEVLVFDVMFVEVWGLFEVLCCKYSNIVWCFFVGSVRDGCVDMVDLIFLYI